jgi:DNA-binding CsgD family transcriptional regulator
MLEHMDALESRLAAVGTEATSLPAYRTAVLACLRAVVPFDVGLMHALSPRVPLETGALVGITPAELAAGTTAWDGLAVELGALRDHALAHEGVAADHEVFPRGSSARGRYARALAGVLRAEALVIAHLSARGSIRAAMVLARRAPDPFQPRELALLRALVPILASGDALQEALDGAERARVPKALRCEDSRLTPRQREIVTHVAMGHTNAEIAEALAISPNTLRNALADAFRRLGASNRADVVRLAVLR